MNRAARVATVILAIALPLSAYAALININTADAAALDTLPGIGPTKAAAIVAYRQAHGPFATIEDIQKVSGIGPVTFSKLSALITVGAARSSVVQPTDETASSQQVQTVVPVTSPNNPAHVENHTAAPRETGTAVSRGAAVVAAEPAVAGGTSAPTPPPETPMPIHISHNGSFFTSTWAVGLLAVVALAGGAFMIL